jgi:Zn finger protein HypA/HybF involved in hydrogenase expression
MKEENRKEKNKQEDKNVEEGESCGGISKDEGKIECPQCGYQVDLNKIDSLRCPRCFSILLTKCEDCQKRCK